MKEHTKIQNQADFAAPSTGLPEHYCMARQGSCKVCGKKVITRRFAKQTNKKA